MGFKEMLGEQIAVARDAAEAADLQGDGELVAYWRARLEDLLRYALDAAPAVP